MDILQLRAKDGNARDIIAFSKKLVETIVFRPVPYIMNDRADLAIVTGADGVHVGQQDLSACEARLLLGEKKWVGVSCQTLEQARQAQDDGADYIGFGSVLFSHNFEATRFFDVCFLTLAVKLSKIAHNTYKNQRAPSDFCKNKSITQWKYHNSFLMMQYSMRNSSVRYLIVFLNT